MKGTINIGEVLSKITGKENFIAIGEIHNTRSAIKFIMDNIEKLIPKESGKIYFLTEFLPPNIRFIPDEARRTYARSIIKHPGKAKIDFDMSEREKDKGDCDIYTLKLLYDFLIQKGIEIHSIEDSYSYGNKELFNKIVADDLPSHEIRVNSLNQVAVKKAREIWERDNAARILIFAGMGHIANSKIKKYSKEGKLEGEKEMQGITELLRKENRQGMSVSIHDPELCEDKEQLQQFSCNEKGFTKYANNSKSITFDSPDYLLFLNVVEHKHKKIKDAFESIFVPGECDITQVKDKGYRVLTLTGHVKEKETVLPNLSNIINPSLSEIIKKQLYRITEMNWSVNTTCEKWSLVSNNEEVIKNIYNHISSYLKNAKMSNIMNTKFVILIENTDIVSLTNVPSMKPSSKQEEVMDPTKKLTT